MYKSLVRNDRSSRRRLFVKVLTTVRRGAEWWMPASNDHAVLGGHQLLNVVALHVKVGIAPAARSAAPSTVKADVDRYKGRAYFRAPSEPETDSDRGVPRESQRPPMRASRTARSKARTRARLAHVTRRGWLVTRASLLAARSPARRPPSTAISEISRALPWRDRVSALSAARRLIAVLSVRLENEHHEREGWDAANRSVI